MPPSLPSAGITVCISQHAPVVALPSLPILLTVRSTPLTTSHRNWRSVSPPEFPKTMREPMPEPTSLIRLPSSPQPTADPNQHNLPIPPPPKPCPTSLNRRPNLHSECDKARRLRCRPRHQCCRPPPPPKPDLTSLNRRPNRSRKSKRPTLLWWTALTPS